MDSTNKKFIKKTNHVQFQKLVELMEEHSELATSTPVFGSSKVAVDEAWDNVAQKINSFGPPIRSASEWKRVWHDQKCRVKKKISDNNKSLHATGGGPCTVSNLTQLELHIDRICHLTSAAAPSGTILGLPSVHKVFEKTPPRTHAKVAVVTPTTSKQTDVNKKAQQKTKTTLDSSDIFTPNILNTTQNLSFPLHTTELSHQSHPRLPHIIAASTPDQVKEPRHNNRKRKSLEITMDRLKLVRQQVDIQNKSMEIMGKHAEAAKIQAEASRIQAEAAKTQAEAAKDQAKSLREVAESTKSMAQSLIDIIKHLKDED